MAKTTKPKAPAVPKGAHIDRNHRYSIDFGEKYIRVIAVNGAGVIVKAGKVEAPPMPETPDQAYTTALSKAVKQAKRAARVPRSINLPCVLVTGGPNIIIHRFVWPDMPATALRSNAITEIAAFLPEDSDTFIISQRIVNRHVGTEGTIPKLDVVVAAIPSGVAKAIDAAVRRAGFVPVRLDVHENARGKLTQTSRILPEPDSERLSPASFALLDINSERKNITLYLNGVFYSNRYFASFMHESDLPAMPPAPIEDAFDHESMKNAAGTPAAPVNVEALANEVVSIIDYIQYRERGSKIECILLYGDENVAPNIVQVFAENTDIPVYKTSQWLKPGLFNKKTAKAETLGYLDAYGASVGIAAGSGLPPKLAADIDLKPVRKKNPAAQLLPPVACALVVLAGLAAFGINFQRSQLNEKQKLVTALERELSVFTVTDADVAAIGREIENIKTEIENITASADDLFDFFLAYPRAGAVLPPIYALESGTQRLGGVSVSNGQVSVSGKVSDLKKLADNIVKLRGNDLFSDASLKSAKAYETDTYSGAAVDFNLSIELRLGSGVR